MLTLCLRSAYALLTRCLRSALTLRSFTLSESSWPHPYSLECPLRPWRPAGAYATGAAQSHIERRLSCCAHHSVRTTILRLIVDKADPCPSNLLA